MRSEKLDLDILNEQYKNIKSILGTFILMYNKEYELTTITEEEQDFIINKTITYCIAIQYDEYNVASFNECFISNEINYIPPYIIPEEFRNKLKDLFNSCIKDIKGDDVRKIFQIDSTMHVGRLLMLEKSMKYQIKLLYKKYLEKMNESNFSIELASVLFRKEIDFKLDIILNNAMKYIICLENNDSDNMMCKEILSKEYSGEDKFKYRLEKPIQEIMKKHAENFLITFLNKETDLDNMDLIDSRDALLRTIEHAKNDIYGIFSYKSYSENKECISIYKNYISLFEQSKKRISNTRTLSKFKKMLKNAKMNYIMKYEEEYIYPFVYDLVVMSFSLLMKTTVYRDELNSIRSMSKIIEEFKNMYVDKSADESYLHKELLELVNVLPLRMELSKDFNDYTIVVIKHFSEVLDTDYKYVASVLRQLRFASADGNKGVYKIDLKLKNKKLSIDEDYFRLLSLDVI